MEINSEQEMLDFGRKFAGKITPPAIIELIGDVGTGKTTFTRGLAAGLGIKEPITSPSFTISKSYALPTGGRLIHYDFYRLKDVGLMADNLKEAVNDDLFVIVEWGESVKNILPKDRIIISIKLQNDGSRKIMIRNSRNSISRGLSEVTTENEGFGPVTTAQRSERNPSLLGFPSEAATSLKTGASDPSPENTVRLFLDTSTPETILKLNDQEYKYPLKNDLAEKLLQFIKDKLEENHKSWQDIEKITFMSGPGSFTGLRIGATVVNTLAHELKIPLYDHKGQKHTQIIPAYGRAANIGSPRP